MEFQKLKTNTKIYSTYTKDGTGFVQANVMRQFKAFKIEFADENEPDEIFIPNSNHDGKEEVEPILLDLQGLTTWEYDEEQIDDEEEVERPVTMEEDRLEEDDFVELEFDIGEDQKKWYSGVVTEVLDAFLIKFHNEGGGIEDEKEEKEDKKKKKKDEYVFLIQFPEEEITQLYLEKGVQFKKVEYDENNEDHGKLTLRRFEENCALIDEQCEALEEEVANCEYHKHLLNQRIATMESENSSFSQETFDEEKLAKKKETSENMKKSTERLVEAIEKGLVIKLDAQERFMSFFKSFLKKKKQLEHCELLQESLSKYFEQDDTSEYNNIEYSHLKTCLHEEFLPKLITKLLKSGKQLEYIKCKKGYEKVKNILDRLKINIMIQKGLKKEMENAISKELPARTKTNKKRGNTLNSSSSAYKKKKRGRPRNTSPKSASSKQPATNKKKRGRGRPSKDSITSQPQKKKRGRGRPRKNRSPGEGLTTQQISEAMHPAQSPASVDTPSFVDSPSSVGTPFSFPGQSEGYQSDKSEDY